MPKLFLKIAETQAEDQHKQLHMTKIELATQRQLVLDLKAELQKAKDTAQATREAFEVAETACNPLLSLGLKELVLNVGKPVSKGITASAP